MTVIEEKYEYGFPLKKRSATELLVLHHSATKSSTAQSIHSAHLARGWSGIGYHYYVRKDGGIHRGRPEDTVGAHAGDVNGKSIGVCFEGNFEEETMGEKQLIAGRGLIADILSRYDGIAVSVHRDHNPTACPGRNFPLAELLRPPEPEKDKGAPSEWAREAADWAVENGIFAGDGNGDYRWGDFVTREELAVLLRKLAGIRG